MLLKRSHLNQGVRRMTTTENTSPLILSVKWGRMEVEGLGLGKDFKLWPGGGRGWDWNEHGTGHSSGIQIGDCQELLDNGSRIIVLSRGMMLRLKINQQTISYLKERNIEVLVEGTKQAVKSYNALVQEGKAVGGLFHTTC